MFCISQIPGGPVVRTLLWLLAVACGTKSPINCIFRSLDQKKLGKAAHGYILYTAFYIITMFIGFLFSQWQRGHLPAAALQLSSNISCGTHCEWIKAFWLLPPSTSSVCSIEAQLYNLYVYYFHFVSKWFGSGWEIIPKYCNSCFWCVWWRLEKQKH